jgi:hypothetical protein
MNHVSRLCKEGMSSISRICGNGTLVRGQGQEMTFEARTLLTPCFPRASVRNPSMPL